MQMAGEKTNIDVHIEHQVSHKSQSAIEKTFDLSKVLYHRLDEIQISPLNLSGSAEIVHLFFHLVCKVS